MVLPWFDAPNSWAMAAFLAAFLLVRRWTTSGSKGRHCSSEGVRSSSRCPPGPRGLPLVGFLPFLGKDFHRTLQTLAAVYGPVYQIFLGSKRVVVISDHKLVRRAFSQAAFSGRPDTELTKLLQGYGGSHVLGPGFAESSRARAFPSERCNGRRAARTRSQPQKYRVQQVWEVRCACIFA